MKEPVSRLTEAALEVLDRHVDGRAARWAEHRMSRREQLIDAAVAAVKQYGSNVGIEQIAATARTSKPVIYRYFADKGELYRAVGERVIAQVVSALRGVLAGSDPQALLRASIDAYLELLEENPELFRFVTQLNGGAPADAEFSRPVVDVLTAALGEQLRSIGLDPAGAQPWGAAVVGFIRAASLWWLDNPATITRGQLREYLAALLWGGGAGVFQLAGREVDPRPPAGVFTALTRQAGRGIPQA